MILSLAGATIVVPDLDRAVAAYRDFLGYTGAAAGRVGTSLAATWGAPHAAATRTAVLRPASGEARFLRLVEGRAPAGFASLKTLGWTAIEIVVQDLAALAERLADSPFRIIGPPAVLDFDFTDALSAMQVEGPGGEILYLTQIDGEIPGFDLPRAASAVGQMFIAVLAASAIAPAAAFYERLGRAAGPTLAARIDVLSDAYGLPRDTRHQLATVALGERSLIEIDAVPQAGAARPLADIGLPCGVAMVAVHVDADPSPSRGAVIVGEAGEWIEWSLSPTLAQDPSMYTKKFSRTDARS